MKRATDDEVAAMVLSAIVLGHAEPPDGAPVRTTWTAEEAMAQFEVEGAANWRSYRATSSRPGEVI